MGVGHAMEFFVKPSAGSNEAGKRIGDPCANGVRCPRVDERIFFLLDLQDEYGSVQLRARTWATIWVIRHHISTADQRLCVRTERQW